MGGLVAVDGGLPQLRQELAIHPGPAARDGTPTWTLHDPANNRFFQLSWPAFEILSRWSLGDMAATVASVNTQTTLNIDAEDIVGVLRFLETHHLAVAASAQDSARLMRSATAAHMSKAQWLLEHYLFFRVPLVRPMPFLRAMLPYLGWVYTRAFWYSIVAVALWGLYLVSGQWDRFIHTFATYQGWQRVFGIGVALSIAKIAHELGHAFTAYRLGCRVPQMGVAFLVMVPVLYTDTNEAWKLPSRRARLQIGVAGVMAELALAACATVLWNFLPDGPLRAGVFLLATSTWLITLALNLSPFMRFDGYFVLSDLLNIPNLHERSFALGRWRLREWLFAFGRPSPESFAPGRRRFLIAFAFATWLYRLTLFLGIAFLVYSYFFKALGVLLLIVELGWFIVYPIQRECAAWWSQRGHMHWNWATRRSVIVFAVLIALLVIPWSGGIRAPAVLGAGQAQWFHARAPVTVTQVAVREGELVGAGETLAVLDSIEVRRHLQLAVLHEREARWELQQQPFDSRLQDSGAALAQHWQAAAAEVTGLTEQTAQLTLRSAFAGRIVTINPALQPGTQLPLGESLLQVVSPNGVKLDAYVTEEDLPQIRLGSNTRFIADQPNVPRVACRVHTIDRINLATLDPPQLASVYGGPIAARLDHNNQAVPLQTIFRVRMDRCTGLDSTSREISGSVLIGGEPRSLLALGWRRLVAVMRREGTL